VIVRALTIGELEQESGVSRPTIYYYVRTGLLPPAQKASPSRALYSEDHLELLREIEALRQQGLRRSAIRSRLEERVLAVSDTGVDLVARRAEETRQAILIAATRRFARKGYKGTRMADLIGELEITPQVLYAHFATKRDLFVACYKVAVQVMDAFLRPRFESARDSAELQVWYMYADSGIKAFAPNLMILATEVAQHDEEARRDLREAYQTIFGDTVSDFRSMRRSEADPPFSDELIAHAIVGAFEQMLVRASLDDEYSWRDVAHNALGLFLAVRAAYQGELDLSDLTTRYGELLDEVASLPPPLPEELRPQRAPGPDRRPPA
jgi:AcrR family transcriptional regulator